MNQVNPEEASYLVALLTPTAKKERTIDDVKIGDRFYYNKHLFKVSKIILNPKAGEPIRDMWGGQVWSEHYAELLAIDLDSLELGTWTIQRRDYKLDKNIIFLE